MKVLVTGITGLIGGGVAAELQRQGHDVVGLARDPGRVQLDVPVVRGDLLSGAGVDAALDGVEMAFYFVHSFKSGLFDAADLDRRAAEGFVASAVAAGVPRLGYLGIHALSSGESRHWRNRSMVESIVTGATPDSFSLRTGLVLGPASTALLYLRMVERAPVIPLGSWRRRLTAVTDVRDVARYLVLAATSQLPGGIYDLPPTEILSHEQVLRRMIAVRGGRRLVVPLPFDDRRISPHLIAAVIGEKRTFVSSLLTMAGADTVPRREHMVPLEPIEHTPLDVALADLLSSGSRRPVQSAGPAGSPPRQEAAA